MEPPGKLIILEVGARPVEAAVGSHVQAIPEAEVLQATVVEVSLLLPVVAA